MVVFDEMDAIARRRGSLTGDTTGVRDGVVNQLLAKMDGVVEAPNVLVVGCTNRPELIDEALLRPGRLEVQLQVRRPDAVGRRDIARIHTRRMKENGALADDARAYVDDVEGGLASRTDSVLRRGDCWVGARGGVAGARARFTYRFKSPSGGGAAGHHAGGDARRRRPRAEGAARPPGRRGVPDVGPILLNGGSSERRARAPRGAYSWCSWSRRWRRRSACTAHAAVPRRGARPRTPPSTARDYDYR